MVTQGYVIDSLAVIEGVKTFLIYGSWIGHLPLMPHQTGVGVLKGDRGRIATPCPLLIKFPSPVIDYLSFTFLGRGRETSPKGVPCGSPKGVPCGSPKGVPCGSPKGVPCGSPKGVPCGHPTGFEGERGGAPFNRGVSATLLAHSTLNQQ